MLLGFHESVFYFCLLETTYAIRVKVLLLYPNQFNPFCTVFSFESEWKFSHLFPTHLHWRSSHHSSQSATKDSEEREAWISFAINGIVEISLQTLSVKSGRDQKNSGQV
jgi:uncharacterized protein YbcC (UPF0753/DUF2309 family)